MWWGKWKRIPGSDGRGLRPSPMRSEPAPGSGEDHIYCGKRMMPRLVRVRNGFGEGMFVAVWRCAACDRITH